MCNLYNVGPTPHHARAEWESMVQEELERLCEEQVAKTDPGVVVTRDADGRLQASTMRWGFHRSFADSINNSRDDKLDGPVWKKAFEEQRCLIPVRWYYEWHRTQKTPEGRKLCLRIEEKPEHWMWMAGVWEESSKAGLTYSMITTAPTPEMAVIHQRMPAILRFEDLETYLDAEEPPMDLIRAFDERLEITEVASPLSRSSQKPKPAQGEFSF